MHKNNTQHKDLIDIGRRIKMLRGKMKQSEFANKFGLKRQQDVSKIESGILKPPAKFLLDISVYYGKPMEWLLNGQEITTATSGVDTSEFSDSTLTNNPPIYSSYTEKSLLLHQQLEHICRDGSEKQINAVAAILEGTEQSIMQFEAIMAEMLKLSKKIDQLETTLKSERRIPGAASQDNQTRRNAK